MVEQAGNKDEKHGGWIIRSKREGAYISLLASRTCMRKGTSWMNARDLGNRGLHSTG